MKETKIRALSQQTFDLLKAQGYAPETLKTRHSILFQIAKFHEKRKYTCYNPNVMDAYLKKYEKRYKAGKILWNHYKNVRKSAQQLSDVFYTGEISHERFYLTPQLADFFDSLLNKILVYEEWGEKKRKSIRNFARPYFKWLMCKGYKDMDTVDESVIQKYLIYCSEHYQKSSLDTIKLSLKQLYRFLFDIKVLPQPYEKWFAFSVGVISKILPAISQMEIAATLGAIDKNTFVGKRNYAILLLAAIAGLRSVDIANLKLNDIDWGNGEIKIFQVKTGVSLVLPLTYDIGEAISDYILNVRPDSNLENVFLSLRAPIGPLLPGSLSVLHNRCRKAAGLPNAGIHGLRRALGRNMIVSGSTVTTVAQVLGHTDIDSTKQYISLDSVHLKECALDFKGIEVKGGTAF